MDLKWVQRNFVPPEKRAEIEKNFADRGIMVLLGARLLPGIRTPIFIIAGSLRVPVGRFLLADLIYAIPLVSLLFWVSYLLTDQVLVIFNKINEYRPLVTVAVLSAVAGALIQRYLLSRHVSTGEPPHMPKIIAKPAEAIGHAIESAIESAVEKVTGRHPHTELPAKEPSGTTPAAEPDSKAPQPDPTLAESTSPPAPRTEVSTPPPTGS
jgi:membrane protein YqaA with SNARE-associated domain